jgi:hypothetical protein
LLAQCVAALSTGSTPEIYPHISDRDDAEMRKRLFAALLAGDRAILLDNILGTFDSAAMASLLTTEMYKDRILSKSESPTVPNNAIVLLTGDRAKAIRALAAPTTGENTRTQLPGNLFAIASRTRSSASLNAP